jgi:GNAT superfamily N-acetyltransferase
MFSKYHYLSSSHNNAANVFICMINDEIAGFISVLHFPHPKVNNMKKVHRLVVLPDYQGLGIGGRILNEIAKIYFNQNYRFSIVTSQPNLIYSLKKQKEWICKNFGRNKSHKGKIESMKRITDNPNSGSENRLTVSFDYKTS